MFRNPLHRIFVECGTDKAAHGYDVPYTMFLAAWREKPIRLLEIGVREGASLRAWRRYLPRAEIFGIDKREEALNAADATYVFLGDQGNPAFLEAVARETGGCFDVVIDDGGHAMHQQQSSFETLWPHLKAGGIYVIEDLETSFNPARFNPTGQQTTVDWLLGRVESICKPSARSGGVQYHFAAHICFILKPAERRELA
jgi:demethylmacrocin O-methyltransferase